jgi:very-short-patch-repair endonuclease
MVSQHQDRWEIPESLRRRMVEVARDLRHNQTPSEEMLWQQLRRKQRGYKVRRQQPIGPFVVDFYVSQARLVIEVDGSIHSTQLERDNQRQGLLEELGLAVLRISATSVEQQLSEVLKQIDTYVQSLSTQAKLQ